MLVDYDDRRFLIQVRSTVDADQVQQGTIVGPGFGATVVERASVVGLQFGSDGLLRVTPSGYHVRNDTMDPRLRDEIGRMVAAIQEWAANLQRRAEGAAAP